MTFDYYASLGKQQACPDRVNECGFASGFIDECAVVFSVAEIERADAEKGRKNARENDDKQNARNREKQAEKRKNEARQCYMTRAAKLKNIRLPAELILEPDFSRLPNSSWFGLEVSFTLKTPWYSRDDRQFHVLDNPVRKDWVFGVPYMSAASWKGLLRWACRMQAGLYNHLETHGMKMDDWKEPDWIVHLFGNEKGEGEHFRYGALVFYPTWFNKVGFEVINPHSRARRAGTQPIYYEVVPAETEGRLQLLYAPLPGTTEIDVIKPADVIDNLIDSIAALLERYGISAKRTAGWGAAKIKQWNGLSDSPPNVENFKKEMRNALAPEGGSR